MSATCPACGQSIPGTAKRICGLCGRQIRRHDKWVIIGSMVQHRHCEHPESYNATGNAPAPQPSMFTEAK